MFQFSSIFRFLSNPRTNVSAPDKKRKTVWNSVGGRPDQDVRSTLCLVCCHHAPNWLWLEQTVLKWWISWKTWENLGQYGNLFCTPVGYRANLSLSLSFLCLCLCLYISLSFPLKLDKVKRWKFCVKPDPGPVSVRANLSLSLYFFLSFPLKLENVEILCETWPRASRSQSQPEPVAPSLKT